MALGDLLFATGFDSQDQGIMDMSGSWTVLTGHNRTAKSTAHLRGNPQPQASLRDSSTGAVASVSEVVVAMGFYGGTDANDFCNLQSPNGTTNVQLGIDSGSHFRIRQGNGTTLGTGATVISANTWYWVWMYIKVNDSTGVIRLKVNNVTEIATTTSLDTRNDSGTNGDKLDRWSGPNSTAQELDDVYIQDATGTSNNGDDIDIGEVTIPYLVPNAAGDTTGMTRGGSDSGTNYGQVDEIPPNDSTDYVFHATNGTLDLYNVTDGSSGVASVKGCVVRARHQKSDAGAKSVRLLLKSGGTTSNGPDIALSTSWVTSARALRKNPVTGIDFTTSELDALQIGLEARA